MVHISVVNASLFKEYVYFCTSIKSLYNPLKLIVMKKLSLLSLLIILSISAFAQTVSVTFTGRDMNGHWVQLDRVVIANLTQNWTETIYWPDTVLTVENNIGINDCINNIAFGLSQNTPNPFNGTTDVNLTVADAGEVMLEIIDVNGHVVASHCVRPQTGIHQFRVSLSCVGVYVLTARQNGKISSIKMVNNAAGNGDNIVYKGMVSVQPKSGVRSNVARPFSSGDLMEYKGYVVLGDEEVESETISSVSFSSQTYTLQFMLDGHPCPGTPTLTDADGNTYGTVWLDGQCWMRENLRTTKYADATSISYGTGSSATVAHWYYPNNSAANKLTYGLLYNWKAVRRNSGASAENPSGVQGICPDGWHVPSDAEWKQMERYLGMNQYDADRTGFRGEIAAQLCGNTGWQPSAIANAAGNTAAEGRNASGFSALPAGCYRDGYSEFDSVAHFWTVTGNGECCAFQRFLDYDNAGVNRDNGGQSDGYSVRCVRGEGGSLANLPIATTYNATPATTSASLSGAVTYDGGLSVTERGFCWSLSHNPTLSDNHTIEGSGLGNFTSIVYGLSANTTYYVRAYATNSEGTSYGNEVNFTTLSDSLIMDDEYSFFIQNSVFIHDAGCAVPCVSSSVDIFHLTPGAIITSATDILEVRLDIEHSSIGDLSITLICPNGLSVLLMPDHCGSYGGNNMASFGENSMVDGDYCDPTSNMPGTGWNYCWSENSSYAQLAGACFLYDNIGHDAEQTVDSSHVAQSYPGYADFVPGQQYYTPYRSFSNLVGCPLNGRWTIQVCDTWSGDNGYLFGWGMVFNPEP